MSHKQRVPVPAIVRNIEGLDDVYAAFHGEAQQRRLKRLDQSRKARITQVGWRQYLAAVPYVGQPPNVHQGRANMDEAIVKARKKMLAIEGQDLSLSALRPFRAIGSKGQSGVTVNVLDVPASDEESGFLLHNDRNAARQELGLVREDAPEFTPSRVLQIILLSGKTWSDRFDNLIDGFNQQIEQGALTAQIGTLAVATTYISA